MIFRGLTRSRFREDRAHFDGNGAVEAGVASFVHLAYATGADGREDLIRAEFFAGGKWHMSYLPSGAFRRSSSQKFSRNVRCVTGFSSFGSATIAARRWPSGARS